MSVKLSQKMLDSWLEASWRDGFNKGVEGEDSIPNFSSLDPRGPEDGKKLAPEEAQVAEFNPCKCGARMFRAGFGVQCSRKPFEGGLLCKTHQKVIDEQSSEFDLPFGWFNKERPTHHLDEKHHGKPIAWSDTKKSKVNSTKKRASAKEMRSQLTELGVSIDGLKGKELTLKYNEVMDSQSDSQSSPAPASPAPAPASPAPAPASPASADSGGRVATIIESIEIVTNSNGTETEIHRHDMVSVESEPVLTLEPENDDESEESETGAGTGLVINSPKTPEPKKDSIPSTTSEFKKMFEELGISTDGLRGKKAFKDKYDEYLKEKEAGEETEDMSDDELDNDTSNFVEVDFEGVEYLEDEDTSDIYNASHQLVGKWNEDGDEIIWASDTFKTVHDTMKD